MRDAGGTRRATGWSSNQPVLTAAKLAPLTTRCQWQKGQCAVDAAGVIASNCVRGCPATLTRGPQAASSSGPP